MPDNSSTIELNKQWQGLAVVLIISVVAGILIAYFGPTVLVTLGIVALASATLLLWLAGWHEIWLLILVIGAFSFGRRFAYISLPLGGFSIYITELLLFVSLGSLVADSMLRNKHLILKGASEKFEGILAIYFLVGVVAFFQGTYNGYDNVLRYSVIVLYSLFYFVTVRVVASRAQFWTLLKAALIGSIFALAYVLSNFLRGEYAGITSTGALRYAQVAYSFYLAAPAITIICLFPFLKRYKVGMLTLAIFQIVGLALVQHRSAWLALGGALLFIFVFSRGRSAMRQRKTVLFIIGLIIVFVSAGYLLPENRLFSPVLTRISSIADYSTDPNASARLMSWEMLVARLASRPLFGFGLGALGVERGTAPIPGLPLANPHNSLVSIFYQMGLFGGVIFLWLVVDFYRRNLARLKEMLNNDEDKAILLALMGSHVFLFILSLFNVVIEGPYMGVFFWIIMGLTDAFARISTGSRKLGGNGAELVSFGNADLARF